MESSKALSRCLQQLSIHNRQSCLRSHLTSGAATRKLRAQRNSSRLTTKLHPSSTRALSTCRRLLQDVPPSSESPKSSTPSTPQSSTAQASPARPNRGIDLSSLVNNPDYVPPAPRRNANSLSRQQQQSSSQSRKPDAAFSQKINSQLDALVAEQRQRSAAAQQQQQRPRQQSNYDAYGAGGTLFNQTRSPTRPAGPTPSSSDLASNIKNWVGSPIDPIDQKLLDETRELARAREQLRLHPSLGKTVDVNEAAGFGVTRAFITLEAKLNGRGNAVRKDEREQKFHVRRGQKRKLKARERWRITFKEGFLGECARVRKMIRQGW